MLRSVPPGIEAFTKAPSELPAFAAAVLACEAAFEAVVAAVFTAFFTLELLRFANQISAIKSKAMMATGQSHFGIVDGTSLRTWAAASETRDVTFDVMPVRPGIESPAGRMLRRLGSSDDSKLPSPDALRPWLLTFDASVPSTMGAAAGKNATHQIGRNLLCQGIQAVNSWSFSSSKEMSLRCWLVFAARADFEETPL